MNQFKALSLQIQFISVKYFIEVHMKTLLLLVTLILVACAKGGGDSPAAQSDPGLTPSQPAQSTPPANPPQSNLTWIELSATCSEILPGFLWAKYDTTIARAYIFESLNNCQHFASISLTLNRGQCGAKSSTYYGAWHFCSSAETANLSSSVDSWLTKESI